MRRTLRLRSFRVALAVAGATGLLLCLSPVAGVPGIESALVLGLLLPPFVAALGARMVDAARVDRREVSAAELLSEVALAALLVVGLPLLALALNLIRVPACGVLEGFAFYLLGPVCAVIPAAICGALFGAATERARIATTLAVLFPIGLALLGLVRFWSTPAVFAYSHLVGYFPGTLYDPDITVRGAYLSFRTLTLLWTIAGAALFATLWDPERGRLGRRVRRAHVGLAGLALVATIGGALGEIAGTELGHRSTSESIAEALGGRAEGARCVAIVPREMPRADAHRLADDCSFRVEQAERVLGVTQPIHVTAFFFRDAEEKRRLMGASNTYVAKPWRDEVYLQVDEWPHPVLFHEVVHVVAGNVGRGPFRISGGLGGLLPSPAIIEGTAVAVAWDARGGLTPHQWARAMLDADLAPPLESVEGLSFLLQPASRAYTTSGSFLRWVMETRGARALRRVYLEGDIEDALGEPVPELEAEWHRFLREEVELPEEAAALARLRFERPGLFSRVCPHEVANLRAELFGELAAGDDRGAVRTCQEILELDDGETGTRVALVGALARRGARDRAERQLARLIGPPSAPTPHIQAAKQALADAAWRRGDSDGALATYRTLLGEPMTDDDARQLEVRILAIEMGGAGEAALRSFLVPRRDANHDAAVLMGHLMRLARVRDDGLAPYLEARQLAFRQRYDLALPRIVAAREAGLPTRRLDSEARRMEGVIRAGEGDVERAAGIFRAILSDGGSSEGERVEARDWLLRLRLMRRADR